MTTIAYRDGVMAADTLVTAGLARHGHVTKIAQAPDGTMVASCGCAVYGHTLRTWAREGAAWPPPKPSEEGDTGLLIMPNGKLVIIQHNGALPLHNEFFALGSGGDFALGAMAMGASAEEAVRAAMTLDTGSGGGVQVVRLDRSDDE